MATRVAYILVLSTYTRYSRVSMRQICQTVLKSEREEILWDFFPFTLTFLFDHFYTKIYEIIIP